MSDICCRGIHGDLFVQRSADRALYLVHLEVGVGTMMPSLQSMRAREFFPPCAATIRNPRPSLSSRGDLRLSGPRRGKTATRRASCRWRGRFARLSRPSGPVAEKGKQARRVVLLLEALAGGELVVRRAQGAAPRARGRNGCRSFPCWPCLPLFSTR